MNKLILDTRIYKENYIMDAVKSYSDIVEIKVKFNSKNNKGVLQFQCSYDKTLLFQDEFCNYLIAVIAKAV